MRSRLEINFPQGVGRIKNSFSKLSLSQWILGRLPECAIFLVGVFLRLTMSWRYDATWGYDAVAHWEYVERLLQHGSLPPLTGMAAAFHPPLFYATAAGLVKLGATQQGLIWLSIACGIVRLALIWLGLEWCLQRRWARIAALALAAVLPASVQIDGMFSDESMHCMFSVAAMLLWLRALRATGRRRWQFACVLGLVFGLGVLTKVSMLVLLAPIGFCVLLDMFLSSKPVEWRGSLKALAPWSAMLAIILAVAGWFYARNVPQYRTPFVTNFETLPTMYQYMGNAAGLPLLDRRTLGFVFSWDLAIYRQPYYPSGLDPHARFFPVALASTFVDYYNYSFSGLGPDQQVGGNLRANNRPLTSRLVALSRGAILGGTVILLGTLAAWVICLQKTFRRDWGLFALLLAPLFTTLFALLYAVKYPYDIAGIIKGVFMQFGATPLYAMFGVSCDWALARRRRWLVLTALLLGLGAVAAYTFCCRTGLLL
jgi:4-amino-4-deoxy-L-arabinose transferase-like glycosyltransferase